MPMAASVVSKQGNKHASKGVKIFGSLLLYCSCCTELPKPYCIAMTLMACLSKCNLR
jgi:hypothetical protein